MDSADAEKVEQDLDRRMEQNRRHAEQVNEDLKKLESELKQEAFDVSVQWVGIPPPNRMMVKLLNSLRICVWEYYGSTKVREKEYRQPSRVKYYL